MSSFGIRQPIRDGILVQGFHFATDINGPFSSTFTVCILLCAAEYTYIFSAKKRGIYKFNNLISFNVLYIFIICLIFYNQQWYYTF
jgi:hypothetical protein